MLYSKEGRGNAANSMHKLYKCEVKILGASGESFTLLQHWTISSIEKSRAISQACIAHACNTLAFVKGHS